MSLLSYESPGSEALCVPQLLRRVPQPRRLLALSELLLGQQRGLLLLLTHFNVALTGAESYSSIALIN